MGLGLKMYVLLSMLFEFAVGEEVHCPRYHYEAQTLERIIRTEFTLDAVKNDIKLMKDETEKDKMKNEEDKQKLEEKLDVVQQKLEDFMNNITNTNDNQKASAASSMRQFCTTDEMCNDIKDSECKWLACKCKPGLSYHHSTRKCLSDCADYGYGNTYQAEMDALLSGFSTKQIDSISLEKCVQECTTETGFICRSAEYWKSKQVCYLSWETLHTNPGSHTKNDRDYAIYTRDCNLE